ncbi:sugar ABC transporter permease [Clostridiaceae bacterium 14S0207]|nr:sugar ABC transporter permease [Clostridiaceae bacterium 14S0207]
MSIYFSFTKYNIMIPEKFIGFQNYKRLFNDNTFKISVLNTIKFTLIVVPIQTTLAIILAVWVKSRSKSFIGKFAKAVMFIPVMSSMIVIGVIWKALLSGDTSPVNQFLGIFHIGPVNWLGDVNLSLYTLMGINIWKNVGYFMVIYIAALMDIPKSYYEAARVDGATKWQEFKNITLPLLKPTTVMVVFLGSIWSLQIFDLVYSLTGGGPGMSTMTMVMYAYNLNFKNFNSGYAMAVANILFFIIAIATILQRKFIKKENSTY